MKERESQNTAGGLPLVRVVIAVAGLVVTGALFYALRGAVIPKTPGDGLLFQSAVLLVVLGSSLLEYKFTKPADSVVNGLMGAVSMVTVYGVTPYTGWWVVTGFCLLVTAVSAVCVATSSGPTIEGGRRRLADLTYRPAVLFGQGRVLYSVVFLYALFSFYAIPSREAVVLLLFWGFFIVIWPLGLPDWVQELRIKKSVPKEAGQAIRTDAPNLVRVRLSCDTTWTPVHVKLYQQSEKEQYYVVPVSSEEHGEDLVGTGLRASVKPDYVPGLLTGRLYDDNRSPREPSEVGRLLGGKPGSSLVGFVVEDSTIGSIRFQAATPDCCRAGMIVWCRVRNDTVYYQITEGCTREESLEANRHGFQVASASQLGTLDQSRGFTKYDWLPPMNTPIFALPTDFGKTRPLVKDGDFIYGFVPGTSLEIGGTFSDMLEYHTAILGITGSGKTELAFDLIRYALSSGVKVICVDLTRRYEGRLADLKPRNLSVSAKLAEELGRKLLDAETGAYGAGKEKRALEEFSLQLRTEIGASVAKFVESTAEDDGLGIITLEEISNSKATVFITELYLTCILHYARDHADNHRRMLIVLEEAHTVVPEASTMGLGDFESKGLVAKISQIALQGRKYGVGLLVIAQRTATVSKTVLTQCNTVVSFTCFDNTSIEFLENVVGKQHAHMIPNLKFLQAVVFGKGVRSEGPIIIGVPFSKEKKQSPKA